MKQFLKQAMIFFVLILTLPVSANQISDNYPEIAKVEMLLFNKSSPESDISSRLSRIEKGIFNKIYSNDDLDKRADRIESYVFGSHSESVESVSETKNAFLQNSVSGYENLQTKEVDKSVFVDLIIETINRERSFKGLLPLEKDAVALHIAEEHSAELIRKGYLSYFNKTGQSPDERYTLAGGTGAVSEVIKGFQLDANEKPIKLTELLVEDLIQVININTDDSQILYNPYITEIGCGIYLSKDKKKFVSILEFVTKGGEFESLKPVLNFGEKISIQGKVKPPYKFKAISVAYLDKSVFRESESMIQDLYFDNEQIIPYFPPQNYIAFGDVGKSNLGKVLKGLGVIAAIGGAPFTGGATAILAPPLISSIQNGPPKEIPLKGGIKANSDGEISGSIELNYQGRSGTYLVSVLAELPGVNGPVVISRRAVRVNSPLQPI